MSRNGRHRPLIWLTLNLKVPNTVFHWKRARPTLASLSWVPVKMPCGCRPINPAVHFVDSNTADRLNLFCKGCNAGRHAYIRWGEKPVRVEYV